MGKATRLRTIHRQEPTIPPQKLFGDELDYFKEVQSQGKAAAQRAQEAQQRATVKQHQSVAASGAFASYFRHVCVKRDLDPNQWSIDDDGVFHQIQITQAQDKPPEED